MEKLINEIKTTMLSWYLFDLTNEQVEEYIKLKDLKFFDTLEREIYADYIAEKITGLSFPMNMDSKEYKDNFFKQLSLKSKEFGYTWNNN